MNTKFKMITTALLIILITFLIWIVIAYYTQPSNILPTNNTPIDNVIGKDIITSTNKDDETIISSDPTNEDNKDEEIKTTDKVITPTEENKGLIMSSDPKTSNTEKQQVLTELDDALMQLLDVIDMVQTVDESKLPTNESEVQQ